MSTPEDVLDQVVSGKISLRQAIDTHPELEDRLTLLSSLAADLRDMPRFKPDGDFRNRARLRLLQHIQDTQQRRQPWWRRAARPVGLPGWAPATGAGLLAGGVLAASLAYASSSALPGSKLYPIKRTVERVQVAMAFGGEAKAGAYLSIADQRAGELSAAAPQLDDSNVQHLSADYAGALQAVDGAVASLPAPSQQLLTEVQTHVAAQASELEARALTSTSRPKLQQTINQAETAASNVADQMTIIAERSGKPGPRDIQLANALPAPPSGGASPVDGNFDVLWNGVSSAPFMAHDVRVSLELEVTAAKQSADAGNAGAAATQLRTFVSRLQQAATDDQATHYTADHLAAQAQAIIAALQ